MSSLKKHAFVITTLLTTACVSLPVLTMTPISQAQTMQRSNQNHRNMTNSPNATKGNIVQVAAADNSLSTFVSAVKAAGLTSTLEGKGPFTVFAPTNQAFNALPSGTLALLLKPANKSLLKQVLLYHVAPGKLTASELKTGNLNTLGGGVAVDVSGNRVIINNASVIQPDIMASNGVIHTIDRVLLTPQLRQTILSKLNAK